MFAEERCKVYFVVGKIVRDGIQRNSAGVIALNVENTFSDKICGTNSAARRGNGRISECGKNAADRCNLIQLGVIIFPCCENVFQFSSDRLSSMGCRRLGIWIGTGSRQKQIDNFLKTDSRQGFQLFGIYHESIVACNVTVR